MIRVSNGKRVEEDRKARIILSPLGLAVLVDDDDSGADEGSIMLRVTDIEYWIVRDYQRAWDEEISHDKIMAMISKGLKVKRVYNPVTKKYYSVRQKTTNAEETR